MFEDPLDALKMSHFTSSYLFRIINLLIKREDLSFFLFRGILEPVGFWKQHCCLRTYGISLRILVTGVFGVDTGPPFVKLTTVRRIPLWRGPWNIVKSLDNVQCGQGCVASTKASDVLGGERPLLFDSAVTIAIDSRTQFHIYPD